MGRFLSNRNKDWIVWSQNREGFCSKQPKCIALSAVVYCTPSCLASGLGSTHLLGWHQLVQRGQHFQALCSGHRAENAEEIQSGAALCMPPLWGLANLLLSSVCGSEAATGTFEQNKGRHHLRNDPRFSSLVLVLPPRIAPPGPQVRALQRRVFLVS